MPEGPEIWILNEAINLYYKTNKSKYIGKHLIIDGICWSFGLKGQINIDDNTNELFKPSSDDWIHGVNENWDNNMSEFKFGLDWLTSLDLSSVVEKFKKSRAKLGTLLINQKYIAGIGVAWGSEILHRAGLRPDIAANSQDLSNLLSALYSIREEIKILYLNELESSDEKIFINSWFNNLYKIRDMKVYKIGEKVEISGRTWYV